MQNKIPPTSSQQQLIGKMYFADTSLERELSYAEEAAKQVPSFHIMDFAERFELLRQFKKQLFADLLESVLNGGRIGDS